MVKFLRLSALVKFWLLHRRISWSWVYLKFWPEPWMRTEPWVIVKLFKCEGTRSILLSTDSSRIVFTAEILPALVFPDGGRSFCVVQILVHFVSRSAIRYPSLFLVSLKLNHKFSASTWYQLLLSCKYWCHPYLVVPSYRTNGALKHVRYLTGMHSVTMAQSSKVLYIFVRCWTPSTLSVPRKIHKAL